MKDAVEMT